MSAASEKRVRPLDHVRMAAPASVVAVLIAVATIWVVPAKSRNPLVETTVWALLVLASFAGWGSIVRFVVAPRTAVDLGLRMAWGAGLLCFVGGLLMVPALMFRSTALVLVEVGIALAMGSLVYERAAVGQRSRYLARLARREPKLMFIALFVVAVVATHCLSAIADWHINPYDDDIAYLAFLKKLSDTGTLHEPFSFRRLSAYGGQTFFLELTSVRAATNQANTFDRCVCFIVIALLMVGYRLRGRRASFLFVTSTLAMLALLQSIAINTASYYSGVLFFLAIFRTLVWLEDKKPELVAGWRCALPLALLSAAACTLRQNYLPIPAVMLGVSYLVRARRSDAPMRDRVVEPLFAAGFSLAALIPWFIVAYQSNHTFLYPVISGTFHKPLALNASAWNFIRECAFQMNVAVEGLPLRTVGLFFLAAAFIRERRERTPLWSLILGALVGFVVLVHGLTQSDAGSIGRYAFAFMIAAVIGVVLTTGTGRERRLGRLEVAGGIAIFAVLLQLVLTREKLWKDYDLRFHNIENAYYTAPRTRETDPPEVKLYERLQAAVPPGERIAVLVDEPHYLNFARNPIWNLDMPGYSSLPPGMPSFKGSEAVEQYLRGLGLRWFMFVLPKYSRYHYRRGYFLELFVHEQEIWRTYSPYLVDFLDSEMQIRNRHRDAYYERGIVVVDLAEPRPSDQPPEPILGQGEPPKVETKDAQQSGPTNTSKDQPRGKESR